MKETESLKKNYEFARVYRKGKYYTSNNLTLYVLSTKGNTKKIGITVSKKAYGKSVKRNRVRRLVRESYKNYEKEIKKNTSMVFVVRKNSELPSFVKIKDEVRYLLNLSGLITDSEKT